MQPETTSAPETLGRRIARLRQERGHSQRDLAKALFVTRQAVSNWERDQTLPDLETLRAIAAFLEVDLNTLCGSAPAPGRRRRPGPRRWRKAAGAGVLALALVLLGVSRLTAPAPEAAPIPSASPPPEEVLPTVSSAPRCSSDLRDENKVRRLMAVDIPRVTRDGWFTTDDDTADLLAADLAALPQDPGPIPLTNALETDFHLFARQYQLALLPGCQDGRFSNWEEALNWIWCAPLRYRHPHGDALSADYVDQAVALWFGDAAYTHGAAGDYSYSHGQYQPAPTPGEPSAFLLRSLERREDSSLQAVLDRFTEDGRYQTGSLTLLLHLTDGQIVFDEVRHEALV